MTDASEIGFNFEQFTVDRLEDLQKNSKETCESLGKVETRLSILETKYNIHVKEKVKQETRIFKALSIFATIASGVMGIWGFIRPHF